MLFSTSPMTLYIMTLTYHMLEMRLKARDTPIGWRNIATYMRLTSWNKSKQKENYLKTHVLDRTVILWSFSYFQYFHKLSNVLLNVTQSDSL